MALPNTNISVGAPPLLWSDVDEALRQVNANFDSIQITLELAGLSPINLETLDTNLKPTVDSTYGLGDITHRWTNVYTGEYSEVYPLNGLWAGNAQIKGIGSTVNLPEGSTIGGDPLTGAGTSLIIDPDKTFFKTVQVDGSDNIVANDFAAILNLNSGTAVQLVVDSGAESITVNNTGVTGLVAGSGTSVSGSTGNVTVTNTGVRSLTSTTSLPSGRTAGTGINIDNSTGDGIKITNTGVITITSGVGITVSSDTATGEFQIINSAPAGSAFAYVEVNGDSGDRISADLVGDVLNITSGTGITLTKNTTTDTLTITVNPVFDLTGNVLGDLTGNVLGDLTGNVTGNTTGYHTGDVKGSIVADDSTILVDGVDGCIVGPVYTSTLRTNETKIVLGFEAGRITQGLDAIAIGKWAGETNQGIRGIAIGHQAGWLNQQERGIAIGSGAGVNNQGAYAIAIGQDTGNINSGNNSIAIGQAAGGTGSGEKSIAIGYLAGVGSSATYANSIILNASGGVVTSAAAGFFVAPVRNQTGANGVVQYDSTTKEVSYSSALGSVSGTFTGNIFTTLIDSADSTAITVTPSTIFSSDVIVENDLIVTQQISVAGSRVINLTELKSVVASSTDFADFQSRIASLV